MWALGCRQLSSERPRSYWRDPTTSFLYVPTFPDGVTWYSIAVALHNFSGARTRRNTYEKLFGLQDINYNLCTLDSLTAFDFRRNVFGNDHCHGASTRAVDDIYGRIVNASEWNPWMHERKPMAWCLHCVEQDLETQGWPAWHVMHQIPFVHDCPVHRSTLVTHCICCGQIKGDGRKWLLPSNVCDVCGAGEFTGRVVASSPGYSALLENTRAFCTARSLPFDEATWVKNMNTVAERATMSVPVDEVIRRQLELRWGVHSVDQIPALLKYEERANWFAWAFDWKVPQSPFVRLLFYDALSSCGLWDAEL